MSFIASSLAAPSTTLRDVRVRSPFMARGPREYTPRSTAFSLVVYAARCAAFSHKRTRLLARQRPICILHNAWGEDHTRKPKPVLLREFSAVGASARRRLWRRNGRTCVVGIAKAWENLTLLHGLLCVRCAGKIPRPHFQHACRHLHFKASEQSATTRTLPSPRRFMITCLTLGLPSKMLHGYKVPLLEEIYVVAS